MDWLNEISILCFVASYGVVLVLEISRIFFHAPLRKLIRIGFVIAGLFAHIVYLACHSQLVVNPQGIWFGNWFSWCLATALILAVAYFWLSFRQPQSAIGLFILPIVMILVGLGTRWENEPQFSVDNARSVWSTIHGTSLLLGTVIVVLGFIFGIGYLLQSNRLKQKQIHAGDRFRLPSLEWLQRSSEYSLIVSTVLLGIGVISGIAINQLQPHPETSIQTIAWTNPVIWTSGVLFIWLLTASIFSLVYRPARQGHKIAYLVVASFLFLAIELGIVWWAGHASKVESPQTTTESMNDETLLVNPQSARSALMRTATTVYAREVRS